MVEDGVSLARTMLVAQDCERTGQAGTPSYSDTGAACCMCSVPWRTVWCSRGPSGGCLLERCCWPGVVFTAQMQPVHREQAAVTCQDSQLRLRGLLAAAGGE